MSTAQTFASTNGFGQPPIKYKIDQVPESSRSNAAGSKLEQQFKAACDAIQSLPKNGPFQPSNEMLLKFYAYFKQATVGPVKSARPSMFKVVERAKYDAWNSVRNLSREEAMQGYIDEIKNIIEAMPHSEYVEKFIAAIGPFYEYVNEEDEDDNEVARNNTSEESLRVSSDQSECSSAEIKSNGVKSDKLNGNSNHLNGSRKPNPELGNGGNTNGSSANNRDYQSDDEEDYCDTSDIINDTEVMVQKFKKQINGDSSRSKWNGANGAFRPIESFGLELSGCSMVDEILERSKTALDDENRFSALIHKCGGETNSPSGMTSGGLSYQQGPRQSRPGSSLSQTNIPGNMDRRSFGGGAGGGGGGGPGNPTDYLLAQETNRQILLILVRLREDTNNVLTRLSFLESSVVSLQTNLQMNRIEGAGATTSAAYTLMSNPAPRSRSPSRRNSNSLMSSLIEFVKTIDWKTVSIAIIWPFIIRLVFYFFKKVRLVIKLKRIRN